jgi:hypothetical protein
MELFKGSWIYVSVSMYSIDCTLVIRALICIAYDDTEWKMMK